MAHFAAAVGSADVLAGPRHGALAMGAEVFRTLEVALYAVAFVWLDALLITARAGAGWIAVGAPVV
ncbi:MAG TPA: hypothetical protein P5074_15760 [Candidatus Nanopelagicales bacterium]|nr:hypothetical protein [Candidatus Nanopelagicales bacterium]